MSEILCRWLNQELRLSKAVEPKTFAKDFSSGYLIGEILHKYQLQNDFSLFMKKDTSISKLNNFTRLEPTLQLLGISFDINKAQDLMQEKQGVATRLLYQLYISLERKKRAEISGTMMEIMQPAASADLHKKAHDIYSDRLHQVVKRDAELKLQKISQHYEEKCQQSPERSVMTHPIQQKRQLKVQDQKQMKNIEKLQISRQKYSGIMPCNQATIVQVPKPPPYTSQLLLKKRQKQQQSREQQAQMVQTEIAQFETKRKKLATSGFVSSLSGRPSPGDFLLCGTNQASVVPKTKLTLQSNSKYIQEIRQRREENAMAREQMEKRRDKFLVEQLRAHEVQEEAQRDEQLVKRLTRQTQQEQRLVSQLLQIRMQKEVIRENRLFREQQYQERREKDFQEALEREAALAQQHKLDRAEEIKQELEFLSRAAAERAQSRYKKHLKSCRDIVEQIVDLATKVGEYRLLTANLIPEKLMKEWKDLLLSGLPLYEPIQGQQPGFQFSTPLDPVELKKQDILNNQDYDEYTNMVGEWTWPKDEEGESKLPPTNNNVLGHVVVRLRRIVCPTITEPPPPPFPHFTFKACAMGKFCSGKTTCLAKISEVYGICVLSADTLIEEALTAYRNGEEVTEQQGEKDTEQLLVSSTSLKSDVSTQEESGERNVKRSNRAIQGEAAEKELKEGNPIPNELVVDIIVEAIRHLPAESGWILDGFPVDITQAYLLEKALGGSVDVGNGVESSRVSLATDPNPPKPLSPSKPVLDLALLLDVPDESVIRRAFSHTDDASDTTTDKDLHLAQIQHRITAFQDTWLKLEKWFGEKQNILVRVDANVAEEELYKRVDAVLQQIFMQKQEALSSGSAEDVSDTGKALDSFSSATPVEDKPPALTESTSSPRKEKVHSANSLSKSNTNSPRVSSKDSQGGSKNQTDSAASVPGSPSWVYVDEPLPRDVSEYLCAHWDEVCDSYIDNIKTVMQQLRSQRIVIIHHLFNIREEFKHYLGRPDLKQELMCQWQKDFNGIPDDMREDDDTKAELHLRLDELHEQLWDISDKRKEQDEQERASLMSKWLDDHIAILINHHSTLMQVELNRFQETLCLLRVYYLSMYTKLPEPPSNFACISLLDVTELKDQDESTQPAETSVFSQEDDGEEQRKIKYVPLLPRTPDSGGVSKTKGQDETEPVQPFSHEKLITDYEEALKTINNLVSAEAYHGEMKKLKERPQQTEGERAGTVSPTTASSPALIEDKPPEKTHHQELINKIHKEYAAALSHEENAAKVRIALVKSHGLVMVQTLQSRAEQAFSSMQKLLEEHYVAEMKSIDQLSEVVRHHIEACAKLQNELVLESTEFYLNGDCNMVASPPPPSRPPPLEKPSRSTPTITQLESLYRQLCNIAPTGLLSTFEFSIFLRDITSVNIGKNTLPEPWINTNGTQLMEIVSLLMDEYELVDWRRFLLSAALPWPFPSLTQLLDVLQRFKAADTGDTGYINKEQYLQTELWFSTESVQDVPEDPTEPLPYDRLSNLHKFFFQLFADHSVSPPRLDYVFMLQYFAADPNPRQGFIRTLSVALGQHLKHSSPGRLVKSLPRIEEAAELSTSELNEEREEDGTACASNSSLMDQEVSISALLDVICHKVTKIKDVYHLPPGCMSQEEQTQHLVHIFKELGFKPDSCVPFSVLSVHPFIQSRMESSTQYQLINIHKVLLAHQAEEETSNSTVS